MTYALEGLSRIRWGFYAASAVLLAALCAVAMQLPASSLNSASGGSSAASSVPVTPKLERLAQSHPGRSVEVIVQLDRSTGAADGRALIRELGGKPTGRVRIINGLVARMDARPAYELAKRDGVRAVSLNATVKKSAVSIDSAALATSFNDSVQSPGAWKKPYTGKGVGVAVVDTGIAGDLPDFKASQNGNGASRVTVSAVTNPYATNAGDSYGHGTHVAGIIAGNSTNRPSSDPLYGKYAGVAPEANLVSIKASDENGDATVLDVIYGIQFAVDYKSNYNIRVLNLSLESSQAQSYKTDPLDAAVESAWLKGIVVVAAAGNRGTSGDSVSYAPGNDPYAIAVGAVDDQGSKNTSDDLMSSWSSRGTTQDGFAKPDILAPGAHIVSNLAPNSAFASMCPTCITDGQYIRAGGTSMAAPMVAGAAAVMLEAYPGMTPNQVKGAMLATGRSITSTTLKEVSTVSLVQSNVPIDPVNQGLTTNTLVDPATGAIDYTRSSWSRSSWSTAAGTLKSSWSKSSWSCNCSKTKTGSIDPTRSTWSKSSWSTSWAK